MPDPTLTTLAVATGGAFLGKFVGPAAEAIGKATWEQAQQLGAKATAYLAAVGREPQPVEPKLLLPLVQAASLETDETLAEKWAALLANAADPLNEVEVAPTHAEILRQLTSPEAKLLATLFAEAISVFSPPIAGEYSEHFKPPAMRKAWALDKEIDVSHIRYSLKRTRRNTYDAQDLEEEQKFQAMIDNLLRQRVIVAAKEVPAKAGESFAPKPGMVSKAFMTSLGYDFMIAVTPPMP